MTQVRPAVAGLVAKLTGGRAFASVLNAIWLVIAARYLGVESFGRLVLLLSLSALVNVVNDFGLPSALTDLVARDREAARSALGHVILRRLGLGVLSAILLVAAYALVEGGEDLTPALLFAVSVLATTVYTSAAALLRGLRNVTAEAVNEFVSRGVVLAIGTAVVVNGGDLRVVALVYASVDLGSALVLAPIAYRRTSGAVEREPLEALRIRRLAPVALAAALGVMYMRIDVWLLAGLADNREVAYYASSYRFLDALLLPAYALGTMLLAAAADRTGADRINVIRRSLRGITAITAPIAILLAVLARPALSVAFGSSFAPAAPMLRLLALAAIPSATVAVLAPSAFLRGRSRAVVVFGGALTAEVLLDVALIPVFGGRATAAVTLLCQCVLAAALIQLLTSIDRPRRSSALQRVRTNE